MRKLSLVLFFAFLFAGKNQAGEPTAWDVPQLMERMAQVPSSTANFTETRYLAVLTEPLELSGTLAYSRPGRIEKHVLIPYDERMVVDRDNFTLEKDGKTRSFALQSHPVAWAFVESIRATLAGDMALLQRFYRTVLQGSKQAWWLTLEPQDAQTAGYVQLITISGSDNRVNKVEILEANGDKSVMTITEKEF